MFTWGETLLKIVAYGALIAVAGYLGRRFQNYKNDRDIRYLPEPEERMRLIEEIRKRRTEGETQQQCIEFLKNEGLRKGVAESLVIDVESEQPPDLENPKKFEWRNWTLNYPGNWKKLADEDLSEEHAIRVEGPGGSGIFFYCIPDFLLEDLVDEQMSNLIDVDVVPIVQWGALKGSGKRLIGVQSTYKIPMEVTVFQSEETEKLTFMALKISEEPQINKAFDLIKRSITTKIEIV